MSNDPLHTSNRIVQNKRHFPTFTRTKYARGVLAPIYCPVTSMAAQSQLTLIASHTIDAT